MRPIDKQPLYMAGNFIYTEPFELAPGRYTLETAMTDRIHGRLGAKRAIVLLPAPGPPNSTKCAPW